MNRNAGATKIKQDENMHAVNMAESATLGTGQSVHIAGEHGAETKKSSNDFNATTDQKHSDLRGKRTVQWCSSAVERPVHIGKAGGSTPSTTTVPLKALLAQKGVADRFLQKVKFGTPGECWEWQGARKRKATYTSAHFKIASYLTVSATRCAYTLATGEDPGQLWVLHHCDNPLCCNPSHLYLGDVKDNAADAKARRRYRPPPRDGERNPRAILTAEQVTAVRQMIADGFTNKTISEVHGVHHSTISKIRTGNAWRSA